MSHPGEAEAGAEKSGSPKPLLKDWAVVLRVTDINLKAVHFVDERVGYAVGGGLDGGVILKTINGGTEWQTLSIGTWQLQAVHFVTADIGWASGYDLDCTSLGVILKTDNGGVSWRRQGRLDCFFYSLHFTRTGTGWVAGVNTEGRGVLLRTGGRGDRWSHVTLPPVRALSAVRFVDGSRGYAVGDAGLIIATTDGGETWTIREGGTREHLTSLFFLDAARGWVAGKRGALLVTQDGGITWTALTVPSSHNLHGVHFTDPCTGWIVGARRDEASGEVQEVVMTTTDGGVGWTTAVAGTAQGAIRGMHFTENGTGVCVGDQGKIMRIR